MTEQPEPIWANLQPRMKWKRNVYMAAVRQYAIDARDGLNWETPPPDMSEALADLTGDGRLLRHLCEQTDLNPEWVAERITDYCHRRMRR